MIWYDFHIHSALSPCGDADMTPNNIVGMAKIKGLDAIAISDHNTVGNVPAAQKVGGELGVAVIAGMEVETSEEVHTLTLYPSYEAAKYVADKVYEALPDIPNRSDIFGEQYFMDSEDNITGREEKLLLSSAAISLEELFGYVREAGGLFIPAHVDRHSYSILTNLGFMPENIDIKYIELSKRVEDAEGYLESRPELKKYKIFRDSDAHYLEDISERTAFLEGSVDSLWRDGI